MLPHNPPTPGQLDISLRAMSPFSRRRELEEREQQQHQPSSSSSSRADSTPVPTSSTPPYHASLQPSTHSSTHRAGDVSPPSYQLIDANQYPAGVAEAMLESIPPEQFAALFAQAANNNTSARGIASANSTAGGRSGFSSVSGGSYEGRTGFMSHPTETAQGADGQNQGLGFRNLLGGWRRSSQDQSQQQQQ